VEEMWIVFKSELLRHIEENVAVKKEYRPKKKLHFQGNYMALLGEHLDSFHQQRITKST